MPLWSRLSSKFRSCPLGDCKTARSLASSFVFSICSWYITGFIIDSQQRISWPRESHIIVPRPSTTICRRSIRCRRKKEDRKLKTRRFPSLDLNRSLSCPIPRRYGLMHSPSSIKTSRYHGRRFVARGIATHHLDHLHLHTT